MQAWYAGLPLWVQPAVQWAAAIVLTIILYLLARFLVRLAVRRLHARAGQSALAEDGARAHTLSAALSEVAGRTSRWILAVMALLIALRMVGLALPGESHAGQLWFVLAALQVALWVDGAIAVGMVGSALRGRGNPVTATLLSLFLRIVVWAVMVLAMLDNLGVNITAMVASLGIGGVAVALALQTLLSDLFASIAIGLDKPFEVGDFIVFGDVAGSIEHIGLKTTRIRSLGGEQIVCSNTELLKQTIQNYKRMQQRRIVFGFRVAYDTPPDGVARVAEAVRRVIESIPDTRYDRAHFARFGDAGLEFEAVYYVLTADYNQYMDIQQRMNLDIMRELRTLEVALALPERRVRIVEAPSADGDAPPASPAQPPGTPLAQG